MKITSTAFLALLTFTSSANASTTTFRGLQGNNKNNNKNNDKNNDKNNGGGGGGGQNNKDNGGGGGYNREDGYIFTMADCPGQCLSYNEQDKHIELQACKHAKNEKMWEIVKSCNNDESFFQIRHVVHNTCIAEPENCSVCNKGISLVDCNTEEAALFSYGNLHKTSPKAYNLYSARCWLKEGLISVLATPSLDAKTCPEDHSIGACERIEWNLDKFSKDVLYYEWSFNQIKSECDADLFPEFA